MVGLWQTGYLFMMGRYGDILYFFQPNTVTHIKPSVNVNGSTSSNRPGFYDSSWKQHGPHIRSCSTQQVFLLDLLQYLCNQLQGSCTTFCISMGMQALLPHLVDEFCDINDMIGQIESALWKANIFCTCCFFPQWDAHLSLKCPTDTSQSIWTTADWNIQIIWDQVDVTLPIINTSFNSYMSSACHPCVFLYLWQCTINETRPQNGSTFRAPLLLSSRIDFEVHIISW